MTDPLPPIQPCASCGAEVRWVKTPLGKPMILNAKPTKRWVVFSGPDGKGGYEWCGRMVETFESHWGTCPHAKEWSGKHRQPNHEQPRAAA